MNIPRFVERRGGGMRVYETSAGARYLITDRLFDPTGEEARQLMAELAADPQYVRLCTVQACFRARLTPKPWRCGMQPPPVRWPFESDDDQRAMDRWLDAYEQACSTRATCRLRAKLGSPAQHARVAEVSALHDELTGAEQELPLA